MQNMHRTHESLQLRVHRLQLSHEQVHHTEHGSTDGIQRAAHAATAATLHSHHITQRPHCITPMPGALYKHTQLSENHNASPPCGAPYTETHKTIPRDCCHAAEPPMLHIWCPHASNVVRYQTHCMEPPAPGATHTNVACIGRLHMNRQIVRNTETESSQRTDTSHELAYHTEH